MSFPMSKVDALEMDARALLTLSKSLVDNAREAQLNSTNASVIMPARIGEAVEAMHAEVLRASHLVATWCATARHAKRAVDERTVRP